MHVPRLITVEFLLSVKAQFTTNVQNNLHVNQDKSEHERSHPFKVPLGRLWKFWQTLKMSWWRVSSFAFAAEYTRVCKCPHRRQSRAVLGCTLDILQWYERFIVLVWATRTWRLSKHFTYILYIFWVLFISGYVPSFTLCCYNIFRHKTLQYRLFGQGLNKSDGI